MFFFSVSQLQVSAGASELHKFLCPPILFELGYKTIQLLVHNLVGGLEHFLFLNIYWE